MDSICLGKREVLALEAADCMGTHKKSALLLPFNAKQDILGNDPSTTSCLSHLLQYRIVDKLLL